MTDLRWRRLRRPHRSRGAAPAGSAAMLLLAALIPCVLARAAPAAPPAMRASPASMAPPAAPAREELTLEQIMADPDWIGNPPKNPYWAGDGRAVYFERKRPGSPLRDLYRLRLDERQPRLVPDAERGAAGAPGGAISRDRRWMTYARDGDVFLENVATGAVRQLTRTAEAKTDPRFMAGDSRVSFRVKETVFVYDLRSGLISQPADLRLAKGPAGAGARRFPEAPAAAPVLDAARGPRRQAGGARARRGRPARRFHPLAARLVPRRQDQARRRVALAERRLDVAGHPPEGRQGRQEGGGAAVRHRQRLRRPGREASAGRHRRRRRAGPDPSRPAPPSAPRPRSRRPGGHQGRSAQGPPRRGGGAGRSGEHTSEL